MFEGGCFYGQIRYEAHGAPFNATLCHCADCRRVTGAPLVAWFSVARSDFQFVAGSPTQVDQAHLPQLLNYSLTFHLSY